MYNVQIQVINVVWVVTTQPICICIDTSKRTKKNRTDFWSVEEENGKVGSKGDITSVVKVKVFFFFAMHF